MGAVERWFAALTEVVIGRARTVVALTLVGVFAALYYTAGHLGINTDTGDLFADDLEWRQTYLHYAGIFPIFSENLILVIDGPTPETTEEAAAALARRLADDEGSLLEWVYWPHGGFFKTNALLFMDSAELADLVDNLAAIQPFLGRLSTHPTLGELFGVTALAVDGVEQVEQARLAAVASKLASSTQGVLDGAISPLSWREIMLGRSATREERRQVMLVKPRLDYEKLLPTQEVMDWIRSVSRDAGIEESRGLRLRITGELAMSHEELDSVSRGAALAALAAVIMVIAVLALGLRSFKLVFASIVTLFAGLACTAAFAAFAIGHLNLISVAFAVLYIGLGIDFAVHYCLRYRDLALQDSDTATALIRANADIGSTLFVCALTTGVGFLAFVFTDFTGVSELGLISGAGMFISLTASVLFLPALLRLMPLKLTPQDAPRQSVRHKGPALRGPILILTLVLALASLFAIPRVEFDRNAINVREADSEAVSTFLDLLTGSDTPPWPMVALVAENEVQALKQRAEQLDVVKGTLSIADFVPEDQDDKLFAIDDLSLVLGLDSGFAWQTARDDPDQLASKLDELLDAIERSVNADMEPALKESLLRLRGPIGRLRERLAGEGDNEELLDRLRLSLLHPLKFELDTLSLALGADRVGMQDLPDELVRRWVAPDGRHRVEIFARHNIREPNALGRFVTEVRSVAPGATDSPVTLFESGNVVVTAFQQALLSAVVLIVIILAVLLRNVVDVLLVLVPLLLAGCFTVAGMVLLGISFNFANVITLPLLLGIGVDNGIHIVRRARAPGAEPSDLLRTSTARAVIVSALTTICGFGNLAFSAHPGTASMGQVLAMGLAFNLVCTLLVLPALLSRTASSTDS